MNAFSLDISKLFLPFSSDSDLRGVGRQVLGGETGEPGRASCGSEVEVARRIRRAGRNPWLEGRGRREKVRKREYGRLLRKLLGVKLVDKVVFL